MGDCYIVRRGAGGMGGLNFQVVGGTSQPNNPKENTIWVNTDAEITAWAFSVEEPTNPVNGMVWIATGASSSIAFNALKKNTLEVYPQNTKIYTGSSWQQVSVRVYQNGAWNDMWDGQLYEAGNEYEGITGGWSFFPCYTNSYDSTNCNKANGKLTVKMDGTAINAACGTNNAIDLTNWKTVKITLTSVWQSCRFGVTKTKGTGTYDDSVVFADRTTAGTLSIDVSALSGKYYIWFGEFAQGTGVVGGVASKVMLYK